MTLAWITDPHFDHVNLKTWVRWSQTLASSHPDGVIVTGDISEGDDVAFQLRRLAAAIDRPIYFVLGNHDFYGGRIGEVRLRCADLAREVPLLRYLSECPPIPLGDEVVLLGDDGWGDGVEGDFENSPIRLNDFRMIDDFRDVSPDRWRGLVDQQGRQSAERLSEKIAGLKSSVRFVLVATHVPPFRESCWYEGQTTDDHWAPFFVCGHVGRMLRTAALANPDREFVVLCGHTHHDGIARITDNLVVHTGFSRYGELSTESMLQISSGGITVPRTPTTGIVG